MQEIPFSRGKRCFSIHGFSLHANRSVNTQNRIELFKLIEYMSRGPLSHDRVELTEDGEVKLRLKSSWTDGTTHLLFSPEEFIEKLLALIPPPRSHLIRWSGVFAPASKYRKDITLDNSKKKGFQFENSRQEECKKNIKNSNWSKMLARTFKIDVTKCIYWRSDMYVVAAILKKEEIQRYLTHEKLDPNPPARAPPVEKELNLSDTSSNVTYLYG